MMDEDQKRPVDQAIISGSKADSEKDVNTAESSDVYKPSDGSTKVEEAPETEYEYITGVKLWLVIASITLVCFLMMLDMSIIVTVRFDNSSMALAATDKSGRLFLESPLISTRSPMWAGTAAHIFWRGMYPIPQNNMA
jgi:hypothetical protein